MQKRKCTAYFGNPSLKERRLCPSLRRFSFFPQDETWCCGSSAQSNFSPRWAAPTDAAAAPITTLPAQLRGGSLALARPRALCKPLNTNLDLRRVHVRCNKKTTTAPVSREEKAASALVHIFYFNIKSQIMNCHTVSQDTLSMAQIRCPFKNWHLI